VVDILLQAGAKREFGLTSAARAGHLDITNQFMKAYSGTPAGLLSGNIFFPIFLETLKIQV
jgi:hypothetical protein